MGGRKVWSRQAYFSKGDWRRDRSHPHRPARQRLNQKHGVLQRQGAQALPRNPRRPSPARERLELTSGVPRGPVLPGHRVHQQLQQEVQRQDGRLFGCHRSCHARDLSYIWKIMGNNLCGAECGPKIRTMEEELDMYRSRHEGVEVSLDKLRDMTKYYIQCSFALIKRGTSSRKICFWLTSSLASTRCI